MHSLLRKIPSSRHLVVNRRQTRTVILSLLQEVQYQFSLAVCFEVCHAYAGHAPEYIALYKNGISQLPEGLQFLPRLISPQRMGGCELKENLETFKGSIFRVE